MTWTQKIRNRRNPKHEKIKRRSKIIHGFVKKLEKQFNRNCVYVFETKYISIAFRHFTEVLTKQNILILKQDYRNHKVMRNHRKSNY